MRSFVKGSNRADAYPACPRASSAACPGASAPRFGPPKLSVRPKADDTHLFLTKFKKGIGPRGIEKLVEKYLKESGIPNASVHTLRHTFATHTIKKGTKLEVVRQALGHESLETTSIYVHLAREMMDRELQENAL